MSSLNVNENLRAVGLKSLVLYIKIWQSRKLLGLVFNPIAYTINTTATILFWELDQKPSWRISRDERMETVFRQIFKRERKREVIVYIEYDTIVSLLGIWIKDYNILDVFNIYFRILIAESYGITNEMRDAYYEVDSMPFNFAFVQKLNPSCKARCIKEIIETSLDGLKKEWWPNFVVKIKTKGPNDGHCLEI